MAVDVEVAEVEGFAMAAVSRHVTRETLPAEIGKGLDVVWPFVRERDLGPNSSVVVYLGDPGSPDGADIEVGVRIERPFDETTDGGVHCLRFPATRAVRAVHVGPYDQMHTTYAALMEHSQREGLQHNGPSWEVYGDWDEDPGKLETEILFAIA